MAVEPATFPGLVLVTGAAGVVGTALCNALLARGVSVVATDKHETAPLPVAGSGRFTWLQADLEQAESRAQIVDGVRSLETGSLGIIHNASFVGDSDLEGWTGPLESQSSETWNRALEVGLTAAFAITRDLAQDLRAKPGSAVVHVSSIYSALGPDWALYEGTTLGNPAAYGVAKAGSEQLTRWLASSLAPHVRVNAVAPGGLKRNQPQEFVERYEAKVPLGRMGNETDVVDSVLFLLSSQSSYITGQVLVVDGGYSIT
jgi:NAD(P)-dependent dehydrogenase (short-subunit alcohol dehydrogenase family)